MTSSASVENSVSYFRLKCVTSSTMPTVKCRLGFGFGQFFVDTAMTIAGVNSFDDSP